MENRVTKAILPLSHPEYFPYFENYLGNNEPKTIYHLGDSTILNDKLTGFFCSQKCPGHLILKTYDFAKILRQSNVTVISGFHSSMEKECFEILLRGTQPVIVCPARSIQNMRIKREHRQLLENGRLLYLSPFNNDQHRPTTQNSIYRNSFVAALSTVIFIAYAALGSKTETFCQKLLSWKKPVYTFDSEYNRKIIEMGAQPIDLNKDLEWTEFLETNSDR